jgi:hypothetical protein
MNTGQDLSTISISSNTSKELYHLKLAELELGSLIAGQVQIVGSTLPNKTKVTGNLLGVQQYSGTTTNTATIIAHQ